VTMNRTRARIRTRCRRCTHHHGEGAACFPPSRGRGIERGGLCRPNGIPPPLRGDPPSFRRGVTRQRRPFDEGQVAMATCRRFAARRHALAMSGSNAHNTM
jgi:hypothetical protein